MWNLWWTLGQVFSEYFGFSANQSTDCSTLIIMHQLPGLLASVMVDSVPIHPKKGRKM
jgi:hypothetical protein